MRIYLTRRQCELVVSQLVRPSGRLSPAERDEIGEVVDRIKAVCSRQSEDDKSSWSGSLSRESLAKESAT